jgi:hypothetical protein
VSELTDEECGFCGADLSYEVDGHTYSRRIGVEYGNGPNRYDGVSEWRCPDCAVRVGRWSDRVLAPGEEEPRYGHV